MCGNTMVSDSTRLEYARVVNMASGTVYIDINDQLIAAETAVSCLIQPEIDDKVLISIDEDHTCYVISVLERVRPENKMVLNGDTHLQVTNGSLHLIADDQTHLVAGSDLNLSASTANVAALDMNVNTENMTFIGKLMTAKMKAIKAVSETVDGFFKRIIQRTEDSYRYVENHDELQAGSKRQLVDGTLNIQTESTHITAEEHVKVDSEQIHLG